MLQPQLLADGQHVPVILEGGHRTAERTAKAGKIDPSQRRPAPNARRILPERGFSPTFDRAQVRGHSFGRTSAGPARTWLRVGDVSSDDVSLNRSRSIPLVLLQLI